MQLPIAGTETVSPEARGNDGTCPSPTVDSTDYSDLSACPGCLNQSGFAVRYGFPAHSSTVVSRAHEKTAHNLLRAVQGGLS